MVSSGHRSESSDPTNGGNLLVNTAVIIDRTVYSVFRISEYTVMSGRMFCKQLTKMDLKGKGRGLIEARLWSFTGKTE